MGKQAVKVVIRTRPTDNFSSKNIQIDQASGSITLSIDKKDGGVVNNQTDAWKFKFEKILHNASQDETYEATCTEIVQSVVEGYNGTIMCYGQTGSGKTYTMSGGNSFKYRGLMPRAVQQVFYAISSKFDQAVTIRISYAEIYNEQIRDLLSKEVSQDPGYSAETLKIEDDQRGGVAIKGLSQHVCDTEEEALNCLFEGEMNRTFRSHYMNATSSRAHTIFTISIESRSRVESSDKVVYSKLHLVDLAGSERTKKTAASGQVLTEAAYINKSLSFLEQVVISLCERKRTHIPYRQCKLTNYLRDSLGGNCKTVMITNVWPEAIHLEETNSTLKFATRMMKVTNEATVNVQHDPALLIKRYEKEIRDLKQELAMHDTLSNRGRVNYDEYSVDEHRNIQKLTNQFLAGEVDDIGEIDSLKMVREVFNCIRGEYRKTSQKIEAVKRQIEANPEAFKQHQEQQKQENQEEEVKKEQQQQEPAASEHASQQDEENKSQKSTTPKQKREAIDKQQAFIEYKQLEEARNQETRIFESREEIKTHKITIKDLTGKINQIKSQIDDLKSKLDRKEEERKLRMNQELHNMEDGNGSEEIIDEEELIMLREMKQQKKIYRDYFNQLKSQKSEVNDMQANIDMSKQMLISNFEAWYAQEFDIPSDAAQDEDYASNIQSHMASKQMENDLDDDAQTYMRVKRKVEMLHKAKKFDKMS